MNIEKYRRVLLIILIYGTLLGLIGFGYIAACYKGDEKEEVNTPATVINETPTNDTILTDFGEWVIVEADSIYEEDFELWGLTAGDRRVIILQRGLTQEWKEFVMGHEYCHAIMMDHGLHPAPGEDEICDVFAKYLYKTLDKQLEVP